MQGLQKTNLGTSLAVFQYLQTLSTKVNSDYFEVLRQKYSEPKIEAMNDAELLGKTAECLLNIHIITGWVLPDDKNYIKILTEQLLFKLKEDFYMLNFSEISFAFRKSVGKKDWGKNMNLELICAVLGEYSIERSVISFEEEKINSKPEQKVYTDEEMLNQRREEIEKAFQAMKKGYYPILHIYFKEVLLTDKLIGVEETIGEFFVRILNSNIENIYEKE